MEAPVTCYGSATLWAEGGGDGETTPENFKLVFNLFTANFRHNTVL